MTVCNGKVEGLGLGDRVRWSHLEMLWYEEALQIGPA